MNMFSLYRKTLPMLSNQLKLVSFSSFKRKKASHAYPDCKDELIRAIQESPWELYQNMVKRIQKKGALAPMPEFKPAVLMLQEELEKESVKKSVQENNCELESFRLNALQALFHISLNFSMTNDLSYPHVAPFSNRYPYLPTINAITTALEFLDIIQRMEHSNISKSYHTDRYRYHLTKMYELPTLKNGKFVYLPLTGGLYLKDFIKLRSVPLGFLGVSTTAVYNDAYWNGPLDFFHHDSNHIRRLDSYNQLSWKGKVPKTIIAKNYDSITYDVLPFLEIRLGDVEHTKNIKKLAMVLLFELFHEYAFALDLTQLKYAFEFKSGDPSPFEHMIDASFNPGDLEDLRMKDMNIQSGFNFFRENPNQPTARYFMDKSPNFIASCLNKLHGDFYDHPKRRSWSLPNMQHRTEKNIAEAAQMIAELLLGHEHNFTYEYLLEMAQDKVALEVYPGAPKEQSTLRL